MENMQETLFSLTLNEDLELNEEEVRALLPHLQAASSVKAGLFKGQIDSMKEYLDR